MIIDLIIFIGLGVYLIYLANVKKESLGKKAALIKICGILLIVCKLVEIIFFR